MAKKAIFIALDNSGSMEGEKAANLRMAMIRLVESFSDFIDTPGNSLDLGICIWGDTADTQVWRGISRAGVSGAIASLDRLNGQSGGTNFAAFAPTALTFFQETIGETYADRTMIFLTDGAPTPPSTADTAAATLADVLDQTTAPFTTLNGTEVNCYAANIDSGMTVHTAKLDNTGADGVPVVAGNARALTAYLKAVTMPVQEHRLWGWPIQWSQGYDEEIAFRTEIIVSRDGTEQRIGQRINPRVSYDFESVLRGRNLRTALARVVDKQGGQFYVPHPREPAVLAVDMPSVALSAQITGAVPSWLIPGVYAIFESPTGETSLGVVIGVSGSTVNLAAPMGRAFPAGSKFRLGVEGRFDGATQFNLLTSDKARVQTQFTGDPVDTPHPTFGAAPVTLEGTELFDMRPNWRQAGEISVEQTVDILDLERGAIDAIFPITFSPRTQKHTFTARSVAELDRILGLFYRASGRRKRFFMPLWADEIRPLGVTYSGQTGVTILGSDFAETYGGLDTYRRVIIRRRAPLADLILAVDSVTLDSSNNSVINLTDPAPDDIIEQEIMSMNWIMPVRFASDRLTVSWLTDAVAEITLTVTTLEGEA